MRNLLIILFLYFTLSLSGATYYIATDGSDSNPGSLSQPWRTIQKGFSSISPGDILYIRGGTYTPAATVIGGMYCGAGVSNKRGTAGSVYKVLAYPGETPVLDCRNMTGTSYSKAGILLYSCAYWQIKGIEITRADQSRSPVRGGSGIYIEGGNHITIENCVSHHNGGPGFETRMPDGDELQFINCDAYSNWDPYSGIPGDNADGFSCGYSLKNYTIRFTGCRSWNNSDDGFDNYEAAGYSGIFYYTRCWSWHNGYRPDGVTQAGQGCGFKYGLDGQVYDGVTRRFSYNCIAYDNRTRGFSQESANVKKEFYNCISYSNEMHGFSFWGIDIPDILKNNISFGNTGSQVEQLGTKRISNHNSWDGGVTVTAADFASVDGKELERTRNADGSLPDINFLHLITGSDLINAGINVGLPYFGTAPDLGPFEVQTGIVDAEPVFVYSTVENAAPAIVEMNYDLILNNLVIPPASSFTAMVNSQARPVSSVYVSGKKVFLTLSSPVLFGDFVIISYTKPATNPIQTATGKEAATIGAQTVTNNVKAPTPVYLSSVIQNSTPAVLEMTYDIALANIIPSAASFKVLVNSISRSVSSVTVSGTKVQLTISSPVVFGNVVTVSYTKPSLNPLQTATGTQAANLSAQKVSNDVIATTLGYVSSVIENTTPSVLEMTFNMTLANILPTASSFNVLVNSTSISVGSVTISGTKVLLALSNPVVYGDIVTVSYTVPTVNQLQSSTGIQAETMSAQSVTNNVAPLIPGYVSSVIENATPSHLEMNYNMSLVNIVPAASAFKVLINSSSRTVSSVAVSGTKVVLTLSTPVVYGNKVTVSYTRPSSKPLQSATGAQVATMSAQVVTNNVNPISPVYISSVIANLTPSRLEMTYNMSLANIVPNPSAFTVLVNSSYRSVSSLAVSGTKVLLTLSVPVSYGDVVTVSYTQPSANPLQTSAGAEAESLSAQTVTNNISPPIPVYVSSIIETATPDLLVMTYDRTLANIVPVASSFKVVVSSVSRTVSSVAISGNKVLLTLSSPVVYGNTVTIAYTKPSANPLQTAAGAQAATIKTQNVTNNIVSPTNTAPTVAITSPGDKSSFTAPAEIIINTNASDAEGTVTIVEFYSGTTLLGSQSKAPYSFTWSNVGQGNYLITAVATDNEGASTTSSAISVSVSEDTPPPTDNQLPSVSISSPTKGNKFEDQADIEIEVIASDPDGNISKVELFNGSELLVELNSAPFIYTWKSVSAGTYQIRAIATDNLNATTTSSMVEFTVVAKTIYDAESEIINLYPNPNNGYFTIDFLVPPKSSRSEIIISDMGGNLVHRETVSAEETTKEISLTNSRSGLYIMTFKDSEIIVTKKIIIK